MLNDSLVPPIVIIDKLLNIEPVHHLTSIITIFLRAKNQSHWRRIPLVSHPSMTCGEVRYGKLRRNFDIPIIENKTEWMLVDSCCYNKNYSPSCCFCYCLGCSDAKWSLPTSDLAKKKRTRMCAACGWIGYFRGSSDAPEVHLIGIRFVDGFASPSDSDDGLGWVCFLIIRRIWKMWAARHVV